MISAKPRAISAARALWPSLRPIDDAAGDGEHVLHRAADFRADEIVGEIGPEGRACDQRLQEIAAKLCIGRPPA